MKANSLALSLLALVAVLALLVVSTGSNLAATTLSGNHSNALTAAPSEALRSAPIAPPQVNVAAISVWTSLPNTGGVYLYVPLNSTGDLVYPTWHAEIVSSQPEAYAVYMNGLQIAQGSNEGVNTLLFNVSGASATVTIGFAGVTYTFTDEVVASVSVSHYYGSTPTPLVATAAQVLLDNAGVFAAWALGLLIAFLIAYRTVVANGRRRVREE